MYSGRCRPACLNNHTGVLSTSSPRAARIMRSFFSTIIAETTERVACRCITPWSFPERYPRARDGSTNDDEVHTPSGREVFQEYPAGTILGGAKANDSFTSKVITRPQSSAKAQVRIFLIPESAELQKSNYYTVYRDSNFEGDSNWLEGY